MCVVSLKDRKRTTELRKSLGIDDITAVVSRRRLTWFGHAKVKIRRIGLLHVES